MTQLQKKLAKVKLFADKIQQVGHQPSCFLLPMFHAIQYTSWFLSSSQMTIETDDMDLAGDVVQSLASYLDIMVIYSSVLCES